MCGLFGAVIRKSSAALNGLTERIAKAHKTQLHRGPDAYRHTRYETEDVHIILGHQRLSILDLSDNGSQPMETRDRCHAIVYNGEVYNYKELADQYSLTNLASSSDTEIVLNRLALDEYGHAFSEFNGMWAIAFLNLRQRQLILSRDRAGIKPLYYSIVAGDLYFASEIKTLLVLTGMRYLLNLPVIAKYVDQSLQDDTEETFFVGINHFPAGQFSVLDLTSSFDSIKGVSYWDPFQKNLSLSYHRPEDHLRDLVVDAIRLRLRSDVPVGMTLSGGLDSSIICHVMSSLLGHTDFCALSATFPGSPHDESKFINIVGQRYGIDVKKVAIDWSPKDTLSLMHKTTWINDSPLGSLSNVAFYLLMAEANRLGVKVILSGQGADELLCGYKKYLGFHVRHLIRSRKYLNAGLTIAGFLWNGTVVNQFSMAEAKRYIPWLQANSADDVMSRKMNESKATALLSDMGTSLANRQWLDYRHFSVPFLTHYEDRMSMAFSREIRLPYLDFRVVEYLLNAPPELKLAKGWTKYLLRNAFKDELPPEITWRKDKQGFINPQENWLRNELKSDIREYFAPGAQIYRHELIDHGRLNKKYDAYVEGSKNIWYREIFNPLGLEVWLQEYKEFIR